MTRAVPLFLLLSPSMFGCASAPRPAPTPAPAPWEPGMAWDPASDGGWSQSAVQANTCDAGPCCVSGSYRCVDDSF
jgi:hypothetical protein